MVEFAFLTSGRRLVAIALAGALSLGGRDARADYGSEGHASAPIAGEARVIDGDSLEIGGTRLRLEGIDAPELAQTCGRSGGGHWPCGEGAAKALTDMVKGRTIVCRSSARDAYGRGLAVCFDGSREINARMVRSGHAWAFVKYSRSYVTAEAAARAAGSGIWQGEAQPAWAYREARWQAAGTTAPSGCAIKGNVSNKGRIYHMPWSPWYGRVTVDPARGERWFCTEGEAQAAGWTAAAAR